MPTDKKMKCISLISRLFLASYLCLFLWTGVCSASTSALNSTKPFFIKQGNTFTVTSREALDLHESLPVATFTIEVSPSSGDFYLQTIADFDLTGTRKIYGDTERQAERILNTFLDREGSTGVLLVGEKGSGKTFLAKWISIQAAARHGMPTVVINQPLVGERFNAFIQSIQQPTVFLFDEFEKVYSSRGMDRDDYYDNHHRNPSQDNLLTLLDGVYSSKMLFLITSNDKNKISSHMRNRPGRIYYVIDFAGLSPDFIHCDDNLRDKSMTQQIITISGFFEAFNFDMLKAMVEEMNRYGETPEQVLEYLNVRPERGRGSEYSVKLIVNGTDVPHQNIELDSGRYWHGHPLLSKVTIGYIVKEQILLEGKALGDPTFMETERFEEIEFIADQIDGMDITLGTYWFWNEAKKARLVLQKENPRNHDINFQKLSSVEGKPRSNT